ncbi:7-deoxyloganetin glucosyltransferase-like [Tasmannia lanceolata]|uniref:7-deoxyloganetin glucosyltransferase-like n=1 Tax=Tasmannia lanceolata TaxID=3420 RepID=UPI0040638004
MESALVDKPHAVLIPFPAQGHINPMIQLAKLLHSKGFYITFVHTEFNHSRMLKSRGPDSLKGLDDFQFETIPDGLPPQDCDRTQDIAALNVSTRKNCAVPFRNLVTKLNNSLRIPHISCIIPDGVMSFALCVAEELDIMVLVFYTMSACGLMGYLNFHELKRRGYTPLKDESYLTNGYLDTHIDWIPGMKNIRLRDVSSFVKTTDPNEIIFNFNIEQAKNSLRARGLILNTFDELEHDVVEAIKCMFPRLYTLGPMSTLCKDMAESGLNSIASNLWKEDTECLDWLDKKDLASVVYVNFGSITVMTAEQLIEFAWGLANSKHPFLWIIRPDLLMGESAILPEEFITETRGRCLLTSWCSQEKVLVHPSIGVFLTHCGWNSMLESICGGVPVLCWPFFAEQVTNCRYACTEWGIGMEINNDLKREEVEGLVRESMEGEKRKVMRNKAVEWKEAAEKATRQGGSSHMNLDRLVKDIIQDKYVV